MNLEQAKKSLSKFGNIVAIKADYVFTLILKNKNGFTLQTMIDVPDAIPDITEKYPVIEVMEISEQYFFLVGKPSRENRGK